MRPCIPSRYRRRASDALDVASRMTERRSCGFGCRLMRPRASSRSTIAVIVLRGNPRSAMRLFTLVGPDEPKSATRSSSRPVRPVDDSRSMPRCRSRSVIWTNNCWSAPSRSGISVVWLIMTLNYGRCSSSVTDSAERVPASVIPRGFGDRVSLRTLSSDLRAGYVARAEANLR